MTDDFHFDTEIIIKLHHQRYRIQEVPIPTYYGSEICYVNGMRYARDVLKAVWRYRKTKQSVAQYPEFLEYFVHYPIKQSKYSSHYYARRIVGSNHTVLDLGCGEGGLAAELKKSGNRITGVDIFPETQNPQTFEQYFAADLNHGIATIVRGLAKNRFDRVLLLDILEHLSEPEKLLRQCREVLRPDGQVIISVPNVANITIRLMLLFGEFNYTARGILDRTHLRFFTRKTARRIVEHSGFAVLEERLTVMPLELVFGWSPDSLLGKTVNRVLAGLTALMPGLFGYQVMFVARPKS
jgi:2-polyprenyl-3-methyl-5-hydroxy-6-metoxy-1,4-benzoquinol methylase